MKKLNNDGSVSVYLDDISTILAAEDSLLPSIIIKTKDSIDKGLNTRFSILTFTDPSEVEYLMSLKRNYIITANEYEGLSLSEIERRSYEALRCQAIVSGINDREYNKYVSKHFNTVIAFWNKKAEPPVPVFTPPEDSSPIESTQEGRSLIKYISSKI